MDLERLLCAVGKQSFVKYYNYFKDENYTSSDILKIITEDYTDKSKRSRLGHAKMIFNNKLNLEALKIIINSKVSEETIIKAKEILNKETSNVLNLSNEQKWLAIEMLQFAIKGIGNDEIIKIIDPDNINEVERSIISKFRVGQSDLRDILLNNKRCCEICGIRNKELLITSHIKPWAKSNKFEKLDSENVLLLCSIHDALFDKGLISFSDDGSIIISTLLDSSDRVLLHLTGEEKILVDSKNKKEYLKFHRENILK